jgi:hypothetical protein
MKLDIDRIKQKILEETKNDRELLQDIYQKACRRAKVITFIKRLLYWAFTVLISLLLWYLMSYVAAIVFVGLVMIYFFLAFEIDGSIFDSSLINVLTKNKDYYALKNSILEKKKQLFKDDPTVKEYLIYLTEKIKIFALSKNNLSFIEQLGSESSKGLHKNYLLEKKIEKSISESEFLFFDNSFSTLKFNWHFSYDGKSLIGTEASTSIHLDEDDLKNDTISWESREKCW